MRSSGPAAPVAPLGCGRACTPRLSRCATRGCAAARASLRLWAARSSGSGQGAAAAYPAPVLTSHTTQHPVHVPAPLRPHLGRGRRVGAAGGRGGGTRAASQQRAGAAAAHACAAGRGPARGRGAPSGLPGLKDVPTIACAAPACGASTRAPVADWRAACDNTLPPSGSSTGQRPYRPAARCAGAALPRSSGSSGRGSWARHGAPARALGRSARRHQQGAHGAWAHGCEMVRSRKTAAAPRRAWAHSVDPAHQVWCANMPEHTDCC